MTFSMISFYLLIFILFPQEIVMVKNVAIKGDYYTTDKLGNVYIVKGNELLKYNSEGNFLYSYDNKFYGQPYSVDASNPLKILLYYKDFNQLIFLDNTLSEISDPVLFDELGLDQIILVCSSGRENFWVFDNSSGQLFLFNKNLKPIQNSISLNPLVSNEIIPDFMIEENNFLFINFPGYGVIIFDTYGNYYKTIGYKKINAFQVKKWNLIYLKDGNYFEYNYDLLYENEYKLPDNLDVKMIRKELKKLFLFNSEGFYIYKIEY